MHLKPVVICLVLAKKFPLILVKYQFSRPNVPTSKSTLNLAKPIAHPQSGRKIFQLFALQILGQDLFICTNKSRPVLIIKIFKPKKSNGFSWGFERKCILIIVSFFNDIFLSYSPHTMSNNHGL